MRTLALLRRQLGCLSKRAFLAAVRRDWAASFPVLPLQNAPGRRVHCPGHV